MVAGKQGQRGLEQTGKATGNMPQGRKGREGGRGDREGGKGRGKDTLTSRHGVPICPTCPVADFLHLSHVCLWPVIPSRTSENSEERGEKHSEVIAT